MKYAQVDNQYHHSKQETLAHLQYTYIPKGNVVRVVSVNHMYS